MSNVSSFTFNVYRTALLAAGLMAVVFGGSIAVGQSTSGSQRPAAADVAPGLEGYCPVCIIEMKKWVKGSPEFQATYDGGTYHFPGAKQRDMFLANPAKYVPALGGDCTVCQAKMGKRVPGSVRHAALSGSRLFLFPGQDQRQVFLANPKPFVDVDLANRGNCIVCRIEMSKDVPGTIDFTAYHHGMRYLFPGAKQRDMFLANPSKYVTAPASRTQTKPSTGREQLVTVSGKSGCAACDHGLAPIGSPNELGLAITAADGQIYVVENAHKLYPRVYEGRFGGLPLTVSGKVVKRDGRATWIEPKALKALN